MKSKYSEDCPEYLADFLTNMLVVRNRGERTVEAYYIDLRTFLRYLKIINGEVDMKDTKWEDITIADTKLEYLRKFTLMNSYEYLAWLAEDRKNTTKTRARKTSALKQFYTFLSDKRGLVDKNPVQKLEVPKSEKKLPKYLPLEDAQKLLEAIDTDHYERDYCMITLFLNCGMRQSELCGMNNGDISFDEKTVRLFGKGRKERIVYINTACIQALEEYLEVRKPIDESEKALFLSRRGTRISRRRTQEIVEECLEKAGLGNRGLSTHKLRHTAATLMYQHGEVDPLVLKEILGHESLTTTEIYVHLSDENKKDAIMRNPLAGEKPHKHSSEE